MVDANFRLAPTKRSHAGAEAGYRTLRTRRAAHGLPNTGKPCIERGCCIGQGPWVQDWQCPVVTELLAAHRRSKQLLLSHLTDGQKSTLDRLGWFEVVGKSGAVYRINGINAGMGRNVSRRRDDDCIEYFDAKPMLRGYQHLPWGDILLGQKLALENDDDQFTRIACGHTEWTIIGADSVRFVGDTSPQPATPSNAADQGR